MSVVKGLLKNSTNDNKSMKEEIKKITKKGKYMLKKLEKAFNLISLRLSVR
jgi:predicted transcriptional regulator